MDRAPIDSPERAAARTQQRRRRSMGGGTLVVLASLLVPRPSPAEQGADGEAREEEARLLYEQGVRLWRARDPSAWLVLRSIPQGTRAWTVGERLLRVADAHYRNGLDHLAAGNDRLARFEFEQGLATGPMDPHHYLDLADIYRARGMRDQAIPRYGSYLAFMTRTGETVEPEVLDDIVGYIGGEQEMTQIPEPPARAGWPISVVLAVAAVLLGGLVVLVVLRRGYTLAELIEQSPDLHPRIAYAVSCLRHELLKHRLGALGDAVQALRAGNLTAEQLAYLRGRLFGGDSLTRLWSIYLETFDRLGGRKLNLRRRDREFRRAEQALRAVEGLRRSFRSPGPATAERLDSLHSQIAKFDRHLRSVSERLCRSVVDGRLLREAVFSVQQEPNAAAVHLDEIKFTEPPEGVYVEVFRLDLLIILRNLVRNAILAMGKEHEGRRALGLEVALRTEPTGDESVLIKVGDTAAARLTAEEIYGRRLEHGLGLVAAAVGRYDGSVLVEQGTGTWTKAVVVRFFRALGEQG